MRAAFLLPLLLLGACAHHVAPVDAPPEELVWPAPPQPARIRFVEDIRDSDWAVPPTAFQKKVWALVGRGTPPEGFQKPYGVVTDSRGRVFVSDTGRGQVLMFDRDGKQFGWRGRGGSTPVLLPLGLAVDAQDHLFVADGKVEAVLEFDADGKFVRAIGGGTLKHPSGIAILEDRGEMWVADTELHALEVFDRDGKHLKTIGKKGTGAGEFTVPTNVATLPDRGEVFVTDTMNFRVDVFDREGTFVRSWGRNGNCWTCFARPKGISLDPEGHVYVVDAAFANVRAFLPDGRLLIFFGEQGNGPGRLWLPAGLHIDAQGRIFVVSQYNWRVNVYQYLSVGEEAVAPPASTMSESPGAGSAEPGAAEPPAGAEP